MRLARLRHQLLIAMGLPACWIQQSPDPNPPPPPDRGAPHVTHGASDPWGTGTTATVATGPRGPVAQAGGPGCTPESVCGRSDTRAGNTCGPFGDSLESFGPSRMSVTRIAFSANPPELGTFALDHAATQQYQRTVSITGPTLPRYCCYAQCTPTRPASTPPLRPPAGMRVATTCVPSPAVSQANAARFRGGAHPDNPDCPAQLVTQPYTHGTNSQCCYGQLQSIPPPDPNYGRRKHYRGRAARVDGAPRVASVQPGDAWSVRRQPALDHLTAAVRSALRDAWAKTAQMEHASIAAFSALSLRLLALGAPAELVARTHAAALDEIRHAQLAFALASAYAGEPLAPATFADAGRLAITGTLAELALETFVDGCLNETVAALEAGVAAERAEDPVVASALRAIADDETRHAELAWAIVAWCVRAQPALAGELRAACARLAGDPATTVECSPPDDDLARHGVVADRELAALRRDTLCGIVEPCLAALLAVVAPSG